MMGVELVPCASEATWERRLKELPGATVFHRFAWLKLVAHLSGSELRLYEISDGAKKVGLFPLFFFRRGAAKLAASPPPLAATPYLGPVAPTEVVAGALEAAALEAKRLSAVYLEFRIAQRLEPGKIKACGFEVEPRSTFVLDLRAGADALWSQFLDSSCRRAIRKAQKSGVEIEEASLAEIVEPYYHMAQEVFSKYHRPPPLSMEQYRQIAETLEAAPLAKVFVARCQGKLLSAGIFPFDEQSVYYLDGVSTESGLAMRPNNLLHWEVICWATRCGIQRYDMVGAGVAGVARFKRSFGPEEVPYTYCFRSLTPWAGLARQAYALFAPAGRMVRYFLQSRRRDS